jgi:thioredoxin 1
MLARIVLGVVFGGGIGLAVGCLGRSAGGQCPILCNPYVATGVGVVLGLVLASRGADAGTYADRLNLRQLTSAEQYRQAAADSAAPLLVEFYTRGCPYCVKQMPVLDAVARRYAGRAAVAVLNAGSVPEVAADEGIRAVPSALLIQDGRVVARLEGYKGEDELDALLDSHLAAGTPAAGAQGARP